VAQDVQLISISDRGVYLLAKNANIAVPDSGFVDLLELEVERISRVIVEIAVAGFALDGFEILGRVHPDGSWLTLASLSTDYTAPSGIIVKASGNLAALAVGVGWVVVDTLGLASLKLRANAAPGGSTVSTYASGG